MNIRAILGLMRSREAYIRDWGDAREAQEIERAPERIFDLSGILNHEHENDEVNIDLNTVGRNLPFPLFSAIGTGEGVMVFGGDADGFYCYCYTAKVPMLFVQFTPGGMVCQGFIRHAKAEPQSIPFSDERVQQFFEAATLLLTLVQRACDDTRHIVSYTLNRAERRAASKELDLPMMRDAIVHRVCLDMREKESFAARRGATVVPTPKRLHEVRAHWRHLRSGLLTRVRAHTRGKRGTVLRPRIYEATEPSA